MKIFLFDRNVKVGPKILQDGIGSSNNDWLIGREHDYASSCPWNDVSLLTLLSGYHS